MKVEKIKHYAKIIKEDRYPSSRQVDYNKKLFKYRTAGVREYWIVDPIKQLIMVYNFEHDTFEQYSFSDKVKAGIYEDFEINFVSLILNSGDSKKDWFSSLFYFGKIYIRCDRTHENMPFWSGKTPKGGLK